MRHDHAFTGRNRIGSVAPMNEPRSQADIERRARWMQICINAGELEAARELAEQEAGDDA